MCRYFNADDDLNPIAVKLLAQKVAKMHSKYIPIARNGTQKTLKIVFEDWFDSHRIESYRQGESVLKSPEVFSHNDLNRRNILVSNGDNDQNFEVFIIDFDWSSYMYRGLDIGDYFINWCQTGTDFGANNFPTDPQMYAFIDAYIAEMNALSDNTYAKQGINSRETLVKEAKIFALMGYIKELEHCFYEVFVKGNMEIMATAEQRFKVYKDLKTRILNEFKEFQ
ncbi:unnamed protein product [Oppiella nova]|uniref:Aminoglycoside phosphotransferase domain-containing protein n=1 Tax=Oppiella nova TaxID=334625 RepID=A0A7R9QG41_9ACAR|nr:unnamed protein product [Oppiella nova]CAG2164307.1 unnamed protein product [Oppiella nova]